MSTDIRPVIRPVGPERPQVYWRRRVVALALVVLLTLAVVLGVQALVAGALDRTPDAAAEGSSAPSAPEQAAQDPPAQDPAGQDPAAQEQAAQEQAEAEGVEGAVEGQGAEGPACTPDQVRVVATADATSYPAGATAKLGMTITNVGTAACSLDAGSAALEVLVVSGSDRIWSSDDYQDAPQSRVTALSPGEAGMLASSVEWPLQRSAEGCPQDLETALPGTYQVTARAGDISSEPLAVVVQE